MLFRKFLPILNRTLSTKPVDAKLVKELRERSGAPMMDCKKSLAAVDGDIAKAIYWLRAKGIAKANSCTDRLVQEGLIALRYNADKSKISMVEVNSETGFILILIILFIFFKLTVRIN